MKPLCSAMLRIKNESRWIRQVLESIYPICHRIFILDDHSTDNTIQICQEFSNVVLIQSPFDTLDESRDKNWLYDQVLSSPLYAGFQWPEWLICIDGDEVLDERDRDLLVSDFKNPDAVAYKLQILYMWSDKTIRIDGVYRHFCRPSAFRIINPDFRFLTTPFGNGANFHCSSIPQELLYQAAESKARLIHLGYIDREIRLRKWKWYNSIDPRNVGEGYDSRHPERGSYPHIVQGDIREVPAHIKLMHAGPLKLAPFQ